LCFTPVSPTNLKQIIAFIEVRDWQTGCVIGVVAQDIGNKTLKEGYENNQCRF